MKRIEYTIGINEKLLRKYNAIVNFLEKNKEVTFENGCLNTTIVDVEYIREKKDNEIFDTNDSIVFRFKDNRSYRINNSNDVKIDRKYKTIYLSKYFSL